MDSSPSADSVPEVLRDFVRNAQSDAMAVIDGEIIVDLNHAFVQMFGFADASEAIGISGADLIVPNERDIALKRLTERIATGVSAAPQVYSCRTKTGVPLQVESSALPWPANPRLAIIILREVTAREEGIETLKESERLYKTLAESIPAGVVLEAPDGTPLYINELAAQITGYTVEELMAGTDYTHPDEHKTHAIHKRALREATSGRNLETRLLHKNGSVIWVSISWEPLFDQHGKLRALHVIFTDIGERKKAEHALQRSEADNRTLLAAIPDLIFRIAVDGTFLEYHGAKELALYAQPSDFLGKKVLEVLPKSTAQSTMRLIEKAVSTGRAQTFEYQLPMNGGERSYEARTIAAGENEVLTIIRDITPRKNADRALQKAHDDLAKAYELQREFLNNITHEVRTPLTAVQGYVQMLLESKAGPLNGEQAALLKRVLASSQHLLDQMSGALEMARLKSGKPSPKPRACKPGLIVESALLHILPQAKQKGLTIKSVGEGIERVGMYDEEKITSILTNLLSNAVKFTQRGEIEVTTTCRQAGVEIIVADPGLGIRANLLGTIFDEFQQLDYPGKAKPTGFGVGLAIVANTVEVLGGELIASSKKGIGTAFTLRIPVLQTWE